MWDTVGSYSLGSADGRLFQTKPEPLSSPHTHWGHLRLEGAGGTCPCLISTQSGSTHLRNVPGYARYGLNSLPTPFLLPHALFCQEQHPRLTRSVFFFWFDFLLNKRYAVVLVWFLQLQTYGLMYNQYIPEVFKLLFPFTLPR